MRAGVLRVVERKLYPGYVFVEMACEEDGSVAEGVWFLVKETTGVGDFIGFGCKPTSMPDHDVELMLVASEKADEDPGLSVSISPKVTRSRSRMVHSRVMRVRWNLSTSVAGWSPSSSPSLAA